MEFEITKNMQKEIKATMDAEMNIYYLLIKGELTPKEKEDITREYLTRIFNTLGVRELNQSIGQQLMKEILKEKCTL